MCDAENIICEANDALIIPNLYLVLFLFISETHLGFPCLLLMVSMSPQDAWSNPAGMVDMVDSSRFDPFWGYDTRFQLNHPNLLAL